LKLGYICALAAAGCLLPARLHAQMVPPGASLTASAPSDEPLAQSEPEIEALLRDQAQRAGTYRYVWTGINAGLAIGCFGLMPLVSHDQGEDYAVSGIASLLGTVTTFAFPLHVEHDEPELDALRSLPPTERRKKLSELLRDGARDEHARVTWPWHLLNLGTSAFTGGIIAIGFGHKRAGVQTGIASLLLGEAQILTQPTGLVGARLSERSALSWQPRLSFAERAVTVGIATSF
jgi:hypothetical protein